eukprot:TRINITY_DN2098_c0_g3_i1.p1 TRINITY_DN2098_c0_g3~~TRINITY_DN2098_c0_g3_i1.p1  ORF type:complete len:348 (-),score=130.66 TRINITY_DN2098_c0_g3_i1:147-1154(-)
MNKDKCALYKSYVDFLKSLTSEANKENVEKPKAKTFLTEQSVVKVKETSIKPKIMDEEMKELKQVYGVEEDDSDTEVEPGFSVQDMSVLMEKQTAENLRLIQELQNKEETLEQMKKENSKVIEEKTKLLEAIRDDIDELTEEAKKKQVQLNEITQRFDSDLVADTSTSEGMAKEKVGIKKIRKTMKQEIAQIKSIFTNTTDKAVAKYKDIKNVDTKSDEIDMLTYITEALARLKMVRDWKFMSSKSSNATAELLKRELEEKDTQKQVAADEMRERNLELARRRKEKLQESLKIARQRVYGKETMKKRMLKEGPIKKKQKEVKKVDDAFDDKYFVE